MADTPMPHAHCPECLGAIGTHRTTCSRRPGDLYTDADVEAATNAILSLFVGAEPEDRLRATEDARTALYAVAPTIAARALRDFAATLDEAAREFRTEGVSDLNLIASGVTDAAGWARRQANLLDPSKVVMGA